MMLYLFDRIREMSDNVYRPAGNQCAVTLDYESIDESSLDVRIFIWSSFMVNPVFSRIGRFFMLME